MRDLLNNPVPAYERNADSLSVEEEGEYYGRRTAQDLAKTWFTALGRNDTETLSKLSADDMIWWIVPDNKFSGSHTKEEFLDNLSALFENASGYLTFTYHEMTGEGDRLSIVATGDLPMKEGRPYRSNYHFLLHFRDGKVAKGKEFLDTVHVNDIFGAPDGSNVDIVKHYLTALQQGDSAAMATTLTEDASYWILPGTTFSGTYDKPSFLKLVDKLVEAQSAPLRLQYEQITAQADRVAIVARGHMPLKAGGSYDNTYHWLFTLRDNKILAVKEFFDTMAVRKAFGAPGE